MSVLSLSVLLLLASATLALASVRIDSPAVARAYVDSVFAENDCTMRYSAFVDRMHADGIIPTEAEKLDPHTGVTKFIGQRRVFAVMETLFASGGLCADEADETIAISKFGGCA
ncbi:hypothetical protein [Aliiroseovarius sp. YM-037]|uniref:hypothetical protein n=1 Tax=Aliiroseovarius sp. YM-037 TaxID=3341728 RepID=UPI003A813000